MPHFAPNASLDGGMPEYLAYPPTPGGLGSPTVETCYGSPCGDSSLAEEPPLWLQPQELIVDELLRGLGSGLQAIDLTGALEEVCIRTLLRYAGAERMALARVVRTEVTTRDNEGVVGVAGLRARTIVEARVDLSFMGVPVPLRLEVAHGLTFRPTILGAGQSRRGERGIVGGRCVRVSLRLAEGVAAHLSQLFGDGGIIAAEECLEAEADDWLRWLASELGGRVLTPRPVAPGGLWEDIMARVARPFVAGVPVQPEGAPENEEPETPVYDGALLGDGDDEESFCSLPDVDDGRWGGVEEAAEVALARQLSRYAEEWGW